MATNDSLAQLVEHLTFNQGVPSSSLGWITNENMPFFERRTAFLCLRIQIPAKQNIVLKISSLLINSYSSNM